MSRLAVHSQIHGPRGHQLRHPFGRNNRTVCIEVLAMGQHDPDIAIVLGPAEPKQFQGLVLHDDSGSAIGEALRASLENIDFPADLTKEDSRSQAGKRASDNRCSFDRALHQTVHTPFSH